MFRKKFLKNLKRISGTLAPASESKGVTEWKRTRAVILPAFNSSKVHISVVQIILKISYYDNRAIFGTYPKFTKKHHIDMLEYGFDRI